MTNGYLTRYSALEELPAILSWPRLSHVLHALALG